MGVWEKNPHLITEVFCVDNCYMGVEENAVRGKFSLNSVKQELGMD